MGNFAKNTKGRAWVGTFQIANMEKAGMTKEEYEHPEKLADFLIDTWANSGKDRVAGVAVCVSENGLYHAHVALYGNLTTLGNVAKIMFDMHTEPQLGGKKDLTAYLLKEAPYDEKGEQVLYSKGLEHIQDNKGKRSDTEDIQDLLEQGKTPSQIMENFAYRKYEKMIRSAFMDRKIRNTPVIKDKNCVWIVGESGTGKTYTYYTLCELYGEENIYLTTDFENGGMDFYVDNGAPAILFLDEFKGQMKFAQLLTMLDKYTRAQVHCRYSNCYCLWEQVYITSVFPPEEMYFMMVSAGKQGFDSIKQLLRRLDTIRYCYIKDGEYKSFDLPANEYEDYADLKKRAEEFEKLQEQLEGVDFKKILGSKCNKLEGCDFFGKNCRADMGEGKSDT